jgi:hypothetical protein
MSNIESINLSIKIDGKAIDVTYKGWTKIDQLIHECNDNRKNLPRCLLETSLNVVELEKENAKTNQIKSTSCT